MPRIGFVFQPVVAPSYHPVKARRLAIIRRPRPKPPTLFKFVFALQGGFIPIKVLVISKSCKVIPMDDTGEIALLVPEDAWR